MSLFRVQTGGSWRLMTSHASQPGNSRLLVRDAVFKRDVENEKDSWHQPLASTSMHPCTHMHMPHTHSDRHINCKVLKDHIEVMGFSDFGLFDSILFTLILSITMFTWMCVCAPGAWSAPGGQQTALDPLEPESQMAVSLHVSTQRNLGPPQEHLLTTPAP